MDDPKTVLEGSVKYRDRKKWKSRWAVISKLSPVADCIHLQLYRDSKERCKNGPTKASLSLEGFLGMETGFTLDKESNTMALVCPKLVVVLAFDSRELLIQWQVKIRANLAEEQQFLVQIVGIPPKSKVPHGPSRLHVLDYVFCLVSCVPPKLLGVWPIKELRRFGAVEGKFCFEGGSLCGKGEGLHILLTNQLDELVHSMNLASKGKLLGKRNTLSRKNSVLETSNRTPVHKSSRHNSEKCSTGDSGQPLLSSGSECSTCDACSEILRSSDPLPGCEDVYSSGKITNTCRIHYRWPSCMSRWGQTSTVASSDVESMDTVSVTLSDYQGPSHSMISCKPSIHGDTLCFCEGQGTWPLSHCTKCGRQFYSRNSLSHQNNGKLCPVSPGSCIIDGDSFRPQWTMGAALPSPSSDATDVNLKKESVYKVLQQTSDRASLCSHTSRSSSASTSSSGSEYSVPRNYLETLYDKPKLLHQIKANTSPSKGTVCKGISTASQQSQKNHCSECENQAVLESKTVTVCPCHEPVNEKLSSKDVSNSTCTCWNKLSFSAQSEKEIIVSKAINTKQSCIVKKDDSNTCKSELKTSTASIPQIACSCNKASVAPYAHYAVPRTTLAGMFLKEKSLTNHINIRKHIIENPLQSVPSDEYDVPRKFTDSIPNDAVMRCKKMFDARTVCSCKSLVSQQLSQQHFDNKHPNHGCNNSSHNLLRMCTCQRVMLWAGSFVPCLGRPPSKVDQGWQCDNIIRYTGAQSRSIPNNYGTICCEPLRNSEFVLVNGKPKHFLNDQVRDINYSEKNELVCGSDTTHTNCTAKQEENNSSKEVPGSNYINVEFPKGHSNSKINDDTPAINYANLDFSHALPLYENSNTILSRCFDPGDKDKSTSETPPLPPRGQNASLHKSPPITVNNTNINAKTYNVPSNRSPKRQEKHENGASYELMCFEKQDTSESFDDDYLLMHPVYFEKEGVCKDDLVFSSQTSSDIIVSKQTQQENECDSGLPLRPFMPYSYPISPAEDECGDASFSKNANSVLDLKADSISRRCHLINEEIELRSARSNSLSELKKIVLLRKRSSSVDGKSNIIPAECYIKSNPASPVSSPKPSIQRKNSLFSKLSLRSKEKSMSTNEIAPPPILPATLSSLLHGYRKNNLHRSAECLKLNEEYVNSDDDLTNEQCDVTQKECSAMKRSSSVPCRSALPNSLPSPRKNISIISELNDLNKEPSVHPEYHSYKSKDVFQRKYSLDSNEKPKKSYTGVRSTCDKQASNDNSNSATESQVHFKRNTSAFLLDSAPIFDPYKSTSSSSSDMSDLIESYTHCSRSSSSCSGSTTSSDYVRSEDLYNQRFSKSSNGKSCTNSSYHSVLPHKPLQHSVITKESISTANSCYNRQASHSNCADDYGTHSKHSSVTNKLSLPSCLEVNQEPNITDSSSHVYHNSEFSTKSCLNSSDPVSIPAVFGNGGSSTKVKKSKSHISRSPTSSTSSLSTSPSITDYSSSSSGNCSLPNHMSMGVIMEHVTTTVDESPKTYSSAVVSCAETSISRSDDISSLVKASSSSNHL